MEIVPEDFKCPCCRTVGEKGDLEFGDNGDFDGNTSIYCVACGMRGEACISEEDAVVEWKRSFEQDPQLTHKRKMKDKKKPMTFQTGIIIAA